MGETNRTDILIRKNIFLLKRILEGPYGYQ